MGNFFNDLKHKITQNVEDGVINIVTGVSNFFNKLPAPVTSPYAAALQVQDLSNKKEKYKSAFRNPTKRYIYAKKGSIPNKVRDTYLNGVNRILSNIRNEKEFRNLTDSDLKIIAMAAYRAGNAETDFMNKAWAKPGGRKDSLNKKIQSSSPESGSFIARLNKAASALSRGNISKAFNIFTSSPFNGDLSSYYNGNALTLDNIHKIRTKQLASGPSVGVTQMKGAKYIVPIKYQSNPQNSVSSYE